MLPPCASYVGCMYVRLKAFWKVCRDLAKIDDEAEPRGFVCGLKGEWWINRAVFAGLGIWLSADETANGRLRKNAMIAMLTTVRALDSKSDGELKERSRSI